MRYSPNSLPPRQPRHRRPWRPSPARKHSQTSAFLLFSYLLSCCSSPSLFSPHPPSSPPVMSSPVPAQVAHDSLSVRKRVRPALMDLGNPDSPDNTSSDTSQDSIVAAKEVRFVSNHTRLTISLPSTSTPSFTFTVPRRGISTNQKLIHHNVRPRSHLLSIPIISPRTPQNFPSRRYLQPTWHPEPLKCAVMLPNL